ncbi:hypothetical protein Tco_0846726 [Tanacetum coccineum]
MVEMRFGFKWRKLIEGSLLNVRASILVNGVLTGEFEICRGLRQRYSLRFDWLKGILMSHLMYANDVIFMGYWSYQNANNLIGILRCFFLTYGLKINVKKSKLLRVGVDHEESYELASILGCGVSVMPFTYLGVPVGRNMYHLAKCKDVVDKFKHKLSKWNSPTLSVGGRLALIKMVLGNSPTYYILLYKVLITIERNLESLLNNFFHWRFMKDLWIKVINNIYGNYSLTGEASFPSSAFSPWIAILKTSKHLAEKGTYLLSLCKRKVTLSSQKDGWIWSHGVSVALARGFIDDVISDVDFVATRWNRLVSTKVNVFFWRLNLNRIPTRVNLDRRDIDIGLVCVQSVIVMLRLLIISSSHVR